MRTVSSKLCGGEEVWMWGGGYRVVGGHPPRAGGWVGGGWKEAAGRGEGHHAGDPKARSRRSGRCEQFCCTLSHYLAPLWTPLCLSSDTTRSSVSSGPDRIEFLPASRSSFPN